MSENGEIDCFEAQTEIANRLKTFVENFKKTPKDRINVGYLSARSLGLTALWEEFISNHKTIISQSDTQTKSTHEYFTAKSFEKYEDIYFDAAGRILEKQMALTNVMQTENQLGSSSQRSNLESTTAPRASQYVHIPQLNVPQFNGCYNEWSSFHDLFTAAVDSNPNLRPVHKLQYLKSLLTGDAELLLRQISITNENYAVAWDTLKKRYNNKRAIIAIHLRKLFSLPHATECASSIRKLLDSTQECINALKLQDINTDTSDCILIHIVTQCIPSDSLSLWEQSIPSNELPTFAKLLEFLENRFRILEFSPYQSQQSSQNKIRTKVQTFHSSAVSTCRACHGPQHALRLCPTFIEMSPPQRLNHVTKSKLCKNCFAFSHQTQTCQSTGRCNICKQKHHSLLHLESQSSSNGAPSASTSSQRNPFNKSSLNQNTITLISRQQSTENCIFATALVKITGFDGTTHSFRALLDNASQENFVSKRVSQFLGSKLQPTTMIISGVGKTQAPKPLGQINLSFGSHHDNAFSISINAIVLPFITYSSPGKQVAVNANFISNLQLADPTYGTPGDIDILLSATVFADLTLPNIRKENASSTIAIQTKLGWVLYGEANGNSSNDIRTCFHVTSEEKISSTLQEFWKIEEVDNSIVHNSNDIMCEQIYERTHSRNAKGRYCVQLPFIENQIPILGSSRSQAVSRFIQIERKFALNPDLQKQYAATINEYIQLGQMHEVTTTEENHKICLPNGQFTYTSYYMPHHAVIKADSTTTKLRVVFDASSKTTNGKSLNDTLLTGPTLQDTLVNLLLRWRKYRIVIKADIEKMYRQVQVNKNHQPYQRIIWRNSTQEPLQEFEINTVTFGTASAPYLVIKTMYQLANDEHAKYPIGAMALRNDFYVDDLLSGADSVDEAIEKQRQLVKILSSGGFLIRKWPSNHTQITDSMEDSAKEICSETESTLKTLGILWHPCEDILSIKVVPITTAVSTKRTLLSEVSKLFDPLGWISPIIVKMKILLQQIWLAGLTWDEPLPNSIQSEWNEFQQNLSAVEDIKITRWLNTQSNSMIELHGFSDASEKAYSAVVYVRVKINHTKWITHLVAAKTRVAPVKQISLPRLELCGAVLLAKLIFNLNKSINATSIVAWTDSEIDLAWLQGHPTRWTTFVANRISEIHNKLDAASWKHVPSKDNPADCASRGISAQQLLQHPLWWHGPTWLTDDEPKWPTKLKKEIPSAKLECRKSRAFLTIPVNDTISTILNDCASLTKAIRVTTYILRWKTHKTARNKMLSAAEIIKSKHILIQHIQKLEFQEEYTALSENQQLPKNSKIQSLNPFLDVHNLIRVGGRLKHANIPYESKHPIIIPRKSRITELIIDEAHTNTMHGGAALMLAHLRTQYWLLDPRNSIRHRIHKCNTCFRFRKNTMSQLMGNLPKPRVNMDHPFNHTGIDYAGPIMLKLRRKPGRPLLSKGYICLFVCLATKAVHLELVGDMSAATFLAALNRFMSRRGMPSNIYSDNGTYFIRAARNIDSDMKLVRQSHEKEGAQMFLKHSIQWHFIPPSAPHFGGLWEAGIKSTKNHLKRIIGNGNLTFEEMTTTLCQIEGCLNSRPLCPISNDPNDFEILTPGHFLIGRPLLSRPQPSLLEIHENRLQYWQRIYQSTERFWKQWQLEYYARLQQRPKWVSKETNIRKGELVLLKDDNLPPSQWSLARILETHPGSDGLTRVVTIKTPTTTLKRPIVKICRLPSQ